MDVQDVHGERPDLQVLAKLERLAKTTVLHVLLVLRVTIVLLLVPVAFCALQVSIKMHLDSGDANLAHEELIKMEWANRVANLVQQELRA